LQKYQVYAMNGYYGVYLIREGGAMIDPAVERRALGVFRRRRVLRVVELTGLLGCSVPTVRKRLRSWGTFTSYNHNGGYYALPEVPQFDEVGLWKYRGVFFSRHGTFLRTVQYLVEHSQMGLEGREIGEVTGMSPRSFGSRLATMPGVVREKVEGRYVYFCADAERAEKQRRAREQRRRMGAAEIPADPEAVAILADRIRHPDSSYEQAAKRLGRQGWVVRAEGIEALLVHHGLEKKTKDTASS